MPGWGDYGAYDANRTGKGDSRNQDTNGDGQPDKNYANTTVGGPTSAPDVSGGMNPWGQYFPSTAFGSMVQATGDSTPFNFSWLPTGVVDYNFNFSQPTPQRKPFEGTVAAPATVPERHVRQEHNRRTPTSQPLGLSQNVWMPAGSDQWTAAGGSSPISTASWAPGQPQSVRV